MDKMTEDLLQVHLNSGSCDDSEKIDPTLISVNLQTIIATAESNLNMVSTESFLNNLDKVSKQVTHETSDIKKFKACDSNPADLHMCFEDAMKQALCDGPGLCPDYRDGCIHHHSLNKLNENNRLVLEEKSLNEQVKVDDLKQRPMPCMGRETNTIQRVEPMDGGNEVDEDFMPNRQSVRQSFEKPIQPSGSNFLTAKVPSLKKIDYSKISSSRNTSSVTKIMKSEEDDLTVKKSKSLPKNTGASESRAGLASRCPIKTQDLKTDKAISISKRVLKDTPKTRSRDVKHRKGRVPVSAKKTTVFKSEPVPKSANIHENELTRSNSLFTPQRSTNHRTCKALISSKFTGSKSKKCRDNALNSLIPAQSVPDVHAALIDHTGISKSKHRGTRRIRLPSLSPKLHESQRPFTPAQKKMTITEMAPSFLRTGFRHNISPRKRCRCKVTILRTPRFRGKIRELTPGIRAPKVLTFAEETNLFLCKG